MVFLKHLARILAAALLIVALFLAAIMVFQDRLLYFPSKVAIDYYTPDGLDTWPKTTAISESNTNSLRIVSPNASHEVLGLIGNSVDAQNAIGTAIVFHGNAGHAGHRSYYPNQFSGLGIRTILAEYPGYGPRPGKPSENVLVSDGVDIVTLAHQQYGAPIWLVGESLGAGVAAAVLQQTPTLVQGIVLITPWNRLADVAAFHYPFLPTSWLLKSSYDSIEALSGFAGPKLIVVAENDRIVPAELGLKLHDQLSQPKRFVSVDNAGHNDWIASLEADFWHTSFDWLINMSTK